MIQLWSWHNGTGATPIPLIWYHDFLSLDDVLAERKKLLKNHPIGWRQNWLPFFSFEGEYYFVECYEESRAAGPVGFFFLEAGEPAYVYVSLTTLLLTSAAWFDAGAVSWDREMEAMVEDVRQQYSLYQEYNEGATFPYHVD